MKLSRLVIYVAAAVIVVVTAAACRATPTPKPTALPTTTPTPTVEPTQEVTGACGQQGDTTVLLLGESLPADQPARGASAIRLVRVDYDARVVRVLALPPYLWVDTPALSAEQINATALTHVYREALQIGPGSDRVKMAYATRVLSQTLANNFGLAMDNTISIRQGVFTRTIDALGGLSIDLPENVDGSPSRFGYYSAGPQVLDGQAVLDYVSIYPAVGDNEPLTEWERFERQKQVLQALYAQVTSLETLPKLPKLLWQFHQDVVTDLGLTEALSLACMLQEPDLSIEYLELDPALVTPGEGIILLPKTDEIIKDLEEMGFVQ
jgi:anionic cell wall polymer biosynthesis LytR-Cps2A-Psr (LCP) family protein